MSKMTTKPCGVLFDLDGVLLDSEGQYSIFWEQMDREFPTGTAQFASYIKGFHLRRILGYFETDAVRQQVLDKLNEFERNMHFEFFPGALEFVHQLRDAGIPMAIVTSSDRKKMQSLYSQHPDFPTLFDHIITGDMVTKAKPDPDCFLMGAKLLRIDIHDCIVFEDSRNGLMAGRASGARVIGLTTTMNAEVVSELSDMTIDAVSQLSVEQMLNTPRTVK
jgi:HAD superfamily hydrolase (TIGR01509 family)